ncbi:hypothetical protein GBAR_LOCUS6693 [Geodia barretti]|uniref:Uncharacterized protein n=1 Tax=Geodia barretti TaxID=519541 RepID=A0AA35RG84_GEOBA|nr:hypothetical protein GBAR_LOCUS6693 [Geodia barretti]
MCQSNIVLN